MPEGPELHLAGLFVNRVCQNRIFSGPVRRSEVSKNPDIDWDEPAYSISATSKGKEVKLLLTTLGLPEQGKNCSNDGKHNQAKKKPSPRARARSRSQNGKIGSQHKSMEIVFQFGMSGKFMFDSLKETGLRKHAHLNFFTKKDDMVLSFVDARRFGKWTPNGDWGSERGPCVILEYKEFRTNVLDNLDGSAFNRPICEALLNQKYFNGIGNYLRAEILYRGGIPPFVCARSVLEPLKDGNDSKLKTEKPDILALCNILPLEVVQLGPGSGYDPDASAEEKSGFLDWLQCYYNPQMKSMADHNRRTIWFYGAAGPMAPKGDAKRGKKRKKQQEPKADKKKAKPEEEDASCKPTPRATSKTTRKNTVNNEPSAKRVTRLSLQTKQTKSTQRSSRSSSKVATKAKPRTSISKERRSRRKQP